MGCYPTVIDRARLAVVLIDVQERLAAAMKQRDAVIEVACLLVGAATILKAPIIVTRQYPQGLGDTVPELRESLDAHVAAGGRLAKVDKTFFCCGNEPLFVEHLTAMDRDQIVVAGMETHICVAQTALALAANGYAVHLASDACCSRSEYSHEVAIARLRTAGVVVTTAEAAIYEAVGEAGTPEFKALLPLVR